MRKIFLIVCFLSVVFSAMAGEAYTNLAGKVIAAMPVKLDGQVVTFDCGAAGERTLPLGIFSPSEQKRIKASVGIREVPDELKGLATEIASQRVRYEARAKANRLSAEKLAENLELLAGSWDHAVEVSNLLPEEKSYWKGKCP